LPHTAACCTASVSFRIARFKVQLEACFETCFETL
jgi:hypothetical protein